jgi:AraC-like DNA-binding protein
MCSSSLRVAAHRLAEYKRLIGPVRLSVMDTRRGLELEYVWPDGMQPPGALAAAELVFWVALARLATRAEVSPTEITTPWVPRSPDAYRTYFGVPVREAEAQRLVFSSRDADLPFVTQNEGLWDFFEPQLRKRLTELELGATVAERVRGALLELLPSGSPSMNAVARALAVSTRTLQRRLRDEGTTFQGVLSETRESLARHYLTSSGLTTSEISFLLGYEEPNSFYRAFRSWTGETPEAVRGTATY